MAAPDHAQHPVQRFSLHRRGRECRSRYVGRRFAPQCPGQPGFGDLVVLVVFLEVAFIVVGSTLTGVLGMLILMT